MDNITRQSKVLDWIDALLASLVGLLSLGLYVRTLAPGVIPGDSAEFQVLAYQFGMAHTTGYPVYMLLAKLFTLLPIRDIAYRVNLFSAFMASLSVAMVYLSGRLVARNRLAALFGALVLSISYAFWSQALIAEVYTPGTAFLVALWLCLLVWYRRGSQWALFLCGLLGGIGLGVHAFLVLFAPGIVVLLLLSREPWKTLWKPALSGALAGIILLFAAYLVVDLHAPQANSFNTIYGPSRSKWGLSEADLQNPLIHIGYMVSAGQWHSAAFADPGRLMPEHIGDFLAGLPKEFSWFTLILILFGFIKLVRQDYRLSALFGVALLFHWIYNFNYDIWDIYVFYIPGYALMAILAAIGLAWIGDWIGNLRMPARPVLVPAILLAFGILGLVPTLRPSWGAVKRGEVPFIGAYAYPVDKDTPLIYKIAAPSIRNLEQNTILFVDWNSLYLDYYAAQVEGDRFDLRFIEAYPRSDTPGLASSILDLIRANIDTHPILFQNPAQEVLEAGFRFRPAFVGSTRYYKVEQK